MYWKILCSVCLTILALWTLMFPVLIKLASYVARQNFPRGLYYKAAKRHSTRVGVGYRFHQSRGGRRVPKYTRQKWMGEFGSTSLRKGRTIPSTQYMGA